MSERFSGPTDYRVYMLYCFPPEGEEKEGKAWRFRLHYPMTEEQIDFETPEALVDYLRRSFEKPKRGSEQ